MRAGSMASGLLFTIPLGLPVMAQTDSTKGRPYAVADNPFRRGTNHHRIVPDGTKKGNMTKVQSSQLNALLAVQTLLLANPMLLARLLALDEANEELTDLIMGVNANAKVQASPSGAAQAKEDALKAVGDLAFEVAGGVLSFAEKGQDAALAAKVLYSRSEVTGGSANAASTRIQGIIDVATENIASLGDHGVTQAKVNSLKQRLKTFDQLRVLPRQAQAAAAAATKQLARLFPKAMRLLDRRVDRLVWQFRATEPEFFDKYQTARAVVSAATHGKEEPAEKKKVA